MSKLARALALAAMLAAMNLAGLTAIAQSHPADQPTRQATMRPPTGTQVGKYSRERPVTAPGSATAETARRQPLPQERSATPIGPPAQATSPTGPAEPSGLPGWLIPVLGVLAAALALVAGVVTAARRAHRTQRAGQIA
jgi:hypothetical protein